MYVHKDARGWHCRPWKNGKRLYKGGFKTKAEAVAWGKKKEKKK
jgi:hypothetical protein